MKTRLCIRILYNNRGEPDRPKSIGISKCTINLSRRTGFSSSQTFFNQHFLCFAVIKIVTNSSIIKVTFSLSTVKIKLILIPMGLRMNLTKIGSQFSRTFSVVMIQCRER